MMQDFFEPMCRVKQVQQPDMYGGFVVQYMDGAPFMGAVSLQKSTTELVIGDKPALKNTYIIAAPIGTGLKQGEMVMKLRGRQMYRVSSNAEQPPIPSVLDFQMCNAEVIVV